MWAIIEANIGNASEEDIAIADNLYAKLVSATKRPPKLTTSRHLAMAALKFTWEALAYDAGA